MMLDKGLPLQAATQEYADTHMISILISKNGRHESVVCRGWLSWLADPQGEPSGRLLSYNPATGKTHVVAQEFWFANGVALSKDEDFIAVVETNTQTVHRVWLTGAKVPFCFPYLAPARGWTSAVHQSPI